MATTVDILIKGIAICYIKVSDEESIRTLP